jgi:hypothetical protein
MLDGIRGYLRDEQGAEIRVTVWPDVAPLSSCTDGPANSAIG